MLRFRMQRGGEHQSSDELSARRTKIWFVSLLAIAALASLALCCVKPFWEDELFEYYSDARPTAGAVIAGQMHAPFSLEPPTFHLLLHFLQKLPIRAEIATRLPSVAALLILQVCVFFIARRLSGKNSIALVAMALPLAMASLEYSAEARVYELLAAAFSFALLNYVYLRDSVGALRALLLLGLMSSLSLGILLHYFGVFLPLPFLAVELAQTKTEKRIDWPILFAVCGSFLAFLLNLPFLPVLKGIQATYFDSGESKWAMLPHTYIWLFGMHKFALLNHLGRLGTFFIPAAVLLLLTCGVVQLWKRFEQEQCRPQLVTAILIVSMLLPAIEHIAGHFHSHAFSPRYSLPAVIPFAILLACLITRFFSLKYMQVILVVLLLSAYDEAKLIHQGRKSSRTAQTNLRVNPALQSALRTNADSHVYIQDLPSFLEDYYYAPAELKPYLVNVQSVNREFTWFHVAVASKFTANIKLSTNLPVTTFEKVASTPGKHLILIYDTQSEWIVNELKQNDVCIEPRGSVLGEDYWKLHSAAECE